MTASTGTPGPDTVDAVELATGDVVWTHPCTGAPLLDYVPADVFRRVDAGELRILTPAGKAAEAQARELDERRHARIVAECERQGHAFRLEAVKPGARTHSTRCSWCRTAVTVRVELAEVKP